MHRRALENITNEMALTLMRTSGSPIVTEAHDFSTCLMDENGEQLAIVARVLIHGASSMMGVKAVIERIRETGYEPRPGDGWIANDPHHGGAMHQGDIGIIMPMFYEGTHVGWGFANAHVLDVGGSGVSGFAPGAYTVYEEGLRWPAIRVISGGRLEEPWEQYIATNVRVPGPVINDLRSMIAANNTAQRKLGELIDRFGLERHREYCEINQQLTEDLLRSRIELLPDGIYESLDWGEYDGRGGPDRLLEVQLRMEVDASDLRFFFSGVPQVDAFVNTREGGVYANVLCPLLTTVGYGDMPFNAGIWRPLSIDLGPPGSILNCRPPAPVSYSHGETGMKVRRMVKDVLNQALALSPDPVLRSRVAGQNNDGPPQSGLAGVDRHGSPTVVWWSDSSTGMGGGAQSSHDGMDCYGSTSQLGAGMPDVETHEAADPAVILWRRIVANSGGAGTFRGGQGIEQAFLLDHVDSPLVGYANTMCADVPSRGFGGGHAASAATMVHIASANVRELIAHGVQPLESNLVGKRTTLPKKTERFVVSPGDVVLTVSGGGGGLGDPLLRDPAVVGSDVRDGYVTRLNALEAYGVETDAEGRVDERETRTRRHEILCERLGREPSARMDVPAQAGLSLCLRAGNWTCGYCGEDLCPQELDWRSRGSIQRRVDVADRYERLAMVVRRRAVAPIVILVDHYCPACGGCLGQDVTVVDGEDERPLPRASPMLRGSRSDS